jgi:hypothetical protein
MTVLVCIAGLTQEVLGEIAREPARFSGEKGNLPIARAISGDLHFRKGMSDAYLAELTKRIRNLPELADVSIILAYVKYPGNETHDFLKAFFPFAATMPIDPFYVNQTPKHNRIQMRTAFLKDLEVNLKKLRFCARQVKDRLSGQRLSPLTLPIRNFQSNLLRSELESLFENLWSFDDPSQAIDNAIQNIKSAHPKDRIKYEERNHSSDLNKPYFRDGRGLRFKSPGNDLHGLMRETGDHHNDSCLIATRVRLGGPIIPRMHYDCDYFPKKDVTEVFINCHDEQATAKKPSHANIAPSDTIW